MQKTLIILFLSMPAAVSLHAQQLNHYLQKQFEVVQEQKNSTTLHVHDTPMSFYSERTTHTRYRVDEVFSNGYNLTATTFLITGKLLAFGQEQTFNSDKPSGMSASDSIAIQAVLNKPVQISVNNSKQHIRGDGAGAMLLLQPEDVSRFLLPFAAADIRQGYSWSDSTVADSSKTISRYLVTQKNTDSIEVMVFSEIELRTAFHQQNQVMLQQLKGYAKGYRWYNPKTGMLKRETLNTTYNGTSETGDQRFPVSISIAAETRLNALN
jgi:hypothetical protein